MPQRPPPLLSGTVLENRFRIDGVLGQGDFGITYLAQDAQRGEECIVRELAPVGALRDESGLLIISKAGEFSVPLLKHRFLKEAQRFMRVAGPGLPLIRTSFGDLGTVFYVREYVPGALTLAQRLAHEGRLDVDTAANLLEKLAVALQRLHTLGALHLDVRPSNVLLTPRGGALLIDPGEARKWHRDLFGLVEPSPFSPPEILGRGRRLTPQSDLYGLAATLYEALAGFPPAPTNSESGEFPMPLRSIRSDVPADLSEAVEAALRPIAHERPRTAISFAEKAGGRFGATHTEDLVADFDRKALLLKGFRFDLRECPSCNGVLENPKPLRPGICPVCHEGSIRKRRIVENLCPNCRMAYLRRVENVEPLSVCPLCSEGFLHRRRRRMFSKEFVYGCDNCEVVFDWRLPMLVVCSPAPGSSIELGESLFAAEWRERSGRADEIWHCSGCGAQYDLLADRRWRQMVPAKTGRYDVLEPSEWFRVASGLPPEAGNAECDGCGADFYMEGQEVALLDTRFDPHHFAQRNMNRLLTLDELRWLGVGKESPRVGLVCTDCETELDFDGDKLKMVRTANAKLVDRVGTSLSLENWHRAGRGLPLKGEETAFEAAFADALREGYRTGSVAFPSRDKALLWKGKGTRLEQSDGEWKATAEGQIEIGNDEVRLGGMIKKWRLPLRDVRGLSYDGSRIELQTETATIALELEPVEVTAALESGNRGFRLQPGDLAARLKLELERSVEAAAATQAPDA